MQSKLPDAPQGFRWQVIWGDEFDTPGKSVPDGSKWEHEIGYLRNQEEQCYTDRLENVFVQDGKLHLRAIKEEYRHEGKVYHYTSGSIRTRNKFSFLYGRIEMLAKLPNGGGCWPAFWTLGTNDKWPACGETDIMEYFAGKDPYTIAGNFIFKDASGATVNDKHMTFLKNLKPYDGFHHYAVDWDKDQMRFYYDYVQYATVLRKDLEPYAGTTPFDNPHFILVNLALGGFGGGPMDPNFTVQTYEVDYVRVSKLVAES